MATIHELPFVTVKAIDSPLKQFKSGIAASDVQCRQDLQLVIKENNGQPVCVKTSTIARLVTQGRSFIDSKDKSGADEIWSAIMDGREIDYTEKKTDDSRILSFSFDGNAKKIMIIPYCSSFPC